MERDSFWEWVSLVGDQPFYKPNGWDGGLSEATFLRSNSGAGAAEHHAKCAAKGDANGDSHGYVLHGRTSAAPKHRPKLMPTPMYFISPSSEECHNLSLRPTKRDP